MGSSEREPQRSNAENSNSEAVEKRVASLVRSLQDSQVSVVWNAARDLARLGHKAAAAIPVLNTVIAGHDPTSRLWARVALVCITGDIEPYRSDILHAVNSTNVFAGMGAAAAGFLGNRLPESIPILTQELSASNADRRWCAAGALAAMGTAASQAASQLAALLADSDEKVRWYAAWALSEVGIGNADRATEQAIVQALGSALNDFDDDVRGYAAKALGRIGGVTAARFLPHLTAMIQDPNPVLGSTAAEAVNSLNGSC